MALAVRAWLQAAWALRRRSVFDIGENRERLIRRLAPGSSFLDFGGMWGVNGRNAFLAEQAGADRVVLVDAMPATEEFEALRRERHSSVRYLTGDLHDADLIRELGDFDVVWCTGVLYHTPNPLMQVEHLSRLVRDRLVLGSRVIPEFPGLRQMCVFYPRLPEGVRTAYDRAQGPGMGPRVGLASAFDREASYANWWWGMTPSAVRAMLAVNGLEVLEEHSATPFMTDWVARPAPDGTSPG
jgi:hypothetical protein